MIKVNKPAVVPEFPQYINDGRIDSSLNDGLYPIDPVTNLPISDISLLLSPDTPDEVKRLTTERMVRLPSSSSVDEDTSVRVLIPRSCQSFAERSQFAQYLESVVKDWNHEFNDSDLSSDNSESTVSDLTSDSSESTV